MASGFSVEGSALGARDGRVMRHRGHKNAVVAVAHAMLRTTHRLLAETATGREPGADHSDRRHAARIKRRAIQLLERQRYRVTLELPAEAPGTIRAGFSEQPHPHGERRPSSTPDDGNPGGHDGSNRAP